MKNPKFHSFPFSIICLFTILFLSSCQPEPEEEIGPVQIFNTDNDLYYYSKRDNIINIYKLDAAGNETLIIDDSEHQDWWVRISPNKQKMLWYKSPAVDENGFKDFNNYDEAELWMANIDGTNPQKIIDLEDMNWTAQGVADWSPDGTELVMAAIDETGHWHIYITNADGTNPQKITSRNSLYADPSWSPDGQQIVCCAFPEDYIGLDFFKLEIHTMNKDGSDETRLTNDNMRDHDPYWSPDGAEIAFESQFNLLHCFIGKWAIRKVKLNTGETIEVVKDNNANGIPRWSADSETLYFGRTICAEYSKLVKTDRDGNNMETIRSSDQFPIYDCDIVE